MGRAVCATCAGPAAAEATLLWSPGWWRSSARRARSSIGGGGSRGNPWAYWVSSAPPMPSAQERARAWTKPCTVVQIRSSRAVSKAAARPGSAPASRTVPRVRSVPACGAKASGSPLTRTVPSGRPMVGVGARIAASRRRTAPGFGVGGGRPRVVRCDRGGVEDGAAGQAGPEGDQCDPGGGLPPGQRRPGPTCPELLAGLAVERARTTRRIDELAAARDLVDAVMDAEAPSEVIRAGRPGERSAGRSRGWSRGRSSGEPEPVGRITGGARSRAVLE
ncbi:hypothetical protein BX285_5477 [Streptomyces sp. 1114.5]|nr:hypothetical protein BX285_5477 [Streptomyces sp. 1114.5]